jgi:hypothetical protein
MKLRYLVRFLQIFLKQFMQSDIQLVLSLLW